MTEIPLDYEELSDAIESRQDEILADPDWVEEAVIDLAYVIAENLDDCREVVSRRARRQARKEILDEIDQSHREFLDSQEPGQ